MSDTQYTADELRRCADELMKSVDKMIDRGQVTKATYDKATQPAVLLHAGADAMEKRDELLVGNREISVKLIAQRSREFILEKAINQARAWYTEDSDLHEKQGRTVKSEICLERANWLNKQLEVLPPSGEDALAKAEARVKELESALWKIHNSAHCHTLLKIEAAAALQVKP